MRWLGFIKRFAPFLLTFSLGIFIASFFVSIAAPSFRFENRSWRNKHRDCHRMKHENRRLRERIDRLERERMNDISNLDVPPPPMPPMPPPPPRVRWEAGR
jgi:hypothetical protein